MATVSGSSSSISSALGVTGKGIGGLATGLNTDELVAALTSGTKLKISKQGQQKQLLNWKMTAYRSMTTALNAFQQKYLKVSTSAATNTNITSNSFFNTYKATSNSDKVSVSATSGATTGGFTINEVTQLATSESYTSTRKMSTTLNLDIKDSDVKANMFTGQTLKLEVEGFTTKTIKLDDLNRYISDDGSGNYSISDMGDFKAGLQKLLNEAYKSDGVVKVGGEGNNITLDSSSAKITINTSNSLLGIDAGDSNRVSTTTTIGDLDAFKNVQGDVLTFNINGYDITVNKRDTVDSMLAKVTNSGANVRMEYDQYNDVFTLTSKLYGADSSFEIKDVQGNLMSEIFGAKGGNGIGTDYLITDDEVVFGTDFYNKMEKMSAGDKKALAENLSNMSFNLTVNGVTKTVKLDTLLGIPSTKLANGTYTADDVYSAINKGIQSAFYGSGIEFGRMESGKTVISTSKGEAFNINASGEFVNLLGLTEDGPNFTGGNIIKDYGFTNKIDSTINTGDGYFDAKDLAGTFQMTINGVTKDVTITPGKNDKGADVPITNSNFLDRLNAAVKEAFGSDAANVSFSADYKKTDGYIATLDPEDYVKRVGESGYEDGYYNIETGEKAFDVGAEDGYYKDGKKVYDKDGFALNEAGERIPNTYKIDGVNLTLNVGANYAGVVETSVSINGALANTMGFASGASNSAATTNTIKLSDLNGGADMVPGAITVNGKTVAYDSTTNLNDFLFELNKAIGNKGAAGIKDGKLFIKSEDGDLTVTDYKYQLETEEVDGETVIKKDANGNPIVAKDGDGKPIIATDDESGKPIAGSILENIFGIKGGKYETAAANYTSQFALEEKKDADGNVIKDENGKTVMQAASSHKTGLNAILTIDGRKIEQSANTISYNGVNLTLNDVSTEAIKIGVQADPDDVITRIKDWMDNYNALVYTLNSAINEGKNRDYEPLTDDQKAEMTDDQVKTWETEAKKGLLRNDQTLRQILADMRGALYERVEAAGISLYDIGIVTKSGLSDPNQAGQLEFDPNASGGGEQRLREMLINNPDKVRLLFTDGENGIGVKLNKIISQAANPSSVDRGTLVRIAGTEQLTGDNTSQLKDKITALDKYIATLKARLETEYNRYWKKFSSLETSVQKMNTQSSWLSSQ